MWGKVDLRSVFRLTALRFNPTHVGKSILESIKKLVAPVQPHACGEKDSVYVVEGSPYRFNPTHVGKSYAKPVTSKQSPVQPHACGEKIR